MYWEALVGALVHLFRSKVREETASTYQVCTVICELSLHFRSKLRDETTSSQFLSAGMHKTESASKLSTMSGAETTPSTPTDQPPTISEAAGATTSAMAGGAADDNDHAGILEDGQVLLSSAGAVAGNQHRR